MSELRLAAEIALRTLAVAAAAMLIQRALLRDGRRIRRLWIAAGIAAIVIALSAMLDLRPRIPSAVFPPSFAAHRAEPAEAQPWLQVRYVRPRFDPAALVRVTWAGGAIAVAAWIAASWVALRRLRRASAPVSPRIANIARDLGTPRGCAIEAAGVAAPCTAGVLAPVILLPRDCEHWTEPKLRAVLAHELAHVRQRDAAWSAAAWLACAALWFAPAVWIIRRRLRAACEFTSDEAAAASCGGARRYARILTEVAESAIEYRLELVTPMAGGASIAMRVERLMERPPARSVWRAIAGTLLLPLLFVMVDERVPLRESPAARAVLADLRSPNADVRATALYRLARWRGREDEVLPILIRHLGDDAGLTATPRWSFVRDGWAPARDVFVRSSPGEIAAIGAASLGAIATDSLAVQLRSSDPVVRRNAAWALGELRHPREVSRAQRAALIRALGDGDATVRAAAAWTLGDLGARDAAGPLQAMLARERNAFARAEAAAALRASERGVSLEFFRHPN